MKPPIEKVLKILALKKQIKDLYEQQDQLIAQLHKEFGAGRFDYDLAEPPVELIEETVFEQRKYIKVISYTDIAELVGQLLENGNYLKFEIVDNLENLAQGKPIFKSTSISPLSFASGSLKRRPKSLVDPTMILMPDIEDVGAENAAEND